MIPLIFIYTHDMMFQAVKEEASQLAIRKADKDGNPLFEQLVFDEAYLIKFRQLFFNAQANIIPTIAVYMKCIPTDAKYFERQDFTKDRDYTFSLLMPCDFNKHVTKQIEDCIFNFIKDWIMYKWLKTKSPTDAAYFLEDAEQSKTDLRIALSKRINPIRRNGYYF